jgi:hypothetical protein
VPVFYINTGANKHCVVGIESGSILANAEFDWELQTPIFCNYTQFNNYFILSALF